MRSVLLPIFALAFATPAMAAVQAPTDSQAEVQAMADKLNNPAVQDALSGSFSTMIAAVMDINVDGIAKALEPLNQGRKIKMHGHTLREMAARNDPHFEAKLHDQSRAAIGGMGALASAFAAMLPQLEAAAKKMGDAMPRGN